MDKIAGVGGLVLHCPQILRLLREKVDGIRMREGKKDVGIRSMQDVAEGCGKEWFLAEWLEEDEKQF